MLAGKCHQREIFIPVQALTVRGPVPSSGDSSLDARAVSLWKIGGCNNAQQSFYREDSLVFSSGFFCCLRQQILVLACSLLLWRGVGHVAPGQRLTQLRKGVAIRSFS
mmetsp:Transcript_36911/g.96573  ORF Transcript_36911/g.96573 Transcript_36911/m.96573 type:complete len:108 (+) Transcript_36911:697-1020(+)